MCGNPIPSDSPYPSLVIVSSRTRTPVNGERVRCDIGTGPGDPRPRRGGMSVGGMVTD